MGGAAGTGAAGADAGGVGGGDDGPRDAPSGSGGGDDGPRDAAPGGGGGASGWIRASDVAVASSGTVVIVGMLDGTVDLGTGPLRSAGVGDLVMAAFNGAGSTLWSQRWGDATSQGEGAVAVDRSGNVFVATSFAGQLDLGGGALASAGSTDICLAKLDADGRHQWSQRFGNASLQWATGAAVDSTGRFVAAAHSMTPFDFGNASPDGGVGTASVTSSVVVLDSSGNRVWSKMWPGAQVVSLAVDSADNVIVAGAFANVVDFGGGALTSAGRTDAFVVVLAANGDHRWSKRYGDVGSAAALAVAADAQRNVLVTGFFDDTVDFGGGPLVSLPSPTRTVVSRDVFVAKLEAAAGAHVWSRKFGDAEGDQAGNSIAVDGAGNVFVSGDFSSTIDFGKGPLTSGTLADTFSARLDAGGTGVWSRHLPARSGQIAIAPAGNLLVTGGFPAGGAFPSATATLVGGSNVFLVQYPP